MTPRERELEMCLHEAKGYVRGMIKNMDTIFGQRMMLSNQLRDLAKILEPPKEERKP